MHKRNGLHRIALVQQLRLLVTLAVQALEIAHDLGNQIHHRKGVGIFLDDLGQGRHLGLVYHAHQHIGLAAGVHTLGGDQGAAVVQLSMISLEISSG